MKKGILILVALVLILCLVGCEETNETKPNETKPELREEENSHIRIWTDEETGVQYIIYSDKKGYGGMGGITPRLNADGTLYTEGEG